MGTKLGSVDFDGKGNKGDLGAEAIEIRGSRREQDLEKNELKRLPVLEFLDHTDIVASYRDRDWDDTFVQLDGDLFFC